MSNLINFVHLQKSKQYLFSIMLPEHQLHILKDLPRKRLQTIYKIMQLLRYTHEILKVNYLRWH